MDEKKKSAILTKSFFFCVVWLIAADGHGKGIVRKPGPVSLSRGTSVALSPKKDHVSQSKGRQESSPSVRPAGKKKPATPGRGAPGDGGKFSAKKGASMKKDVAPRTVKDTGKMHGVADGKKMPGGPSGAKEPGKMGGVKDVKADVPHMNKHSAGFKDSVKGAFKESSFDKDAGKTGLGKGEFGKVKPGDAGFAAEGKFSAGKKGFDAPMGSSLKEPGGLGFKEGMKQQAAFDKIGMGGKWEGIKDGPGAMGDKMPGGKDFGGGGWGKQKGPFNPKDGTGMGDGGKKGFNNFGKDKSATDSKTGGKGKRGVGGFGQSGKKDYGSQAGSGKNDGKKNYGKDDNNNSGSDAGKGKKKDSSSNSSNDSEKDKGDKGDKGSKEKDKGKEKDSGGGPIGPDPGIDDGTGGDADPLDLFTTGNEESREGGMPDSGAVGINRRTGDRGGSNSSTDTDESRDARINPAHADQPIETRDEGPSLIWQVQNYAVDPADGDRRASQSDGNVTTENRPGGQTLIEEGAAPVEGRGQEPPR